MIVKIHSRGAGAGSGPVDYLLGKERDREKAVVLRGEPERIRQLIDGCDFARAYTSGVLSFREENLPDDEKERLMEEFEQTLLPGLDGDQYACLWVEHRDKDRLELNFVIPNIELQSGKRLQPYYDRADRPRVNAWQTLTNDRLNLDDPHDPARRRTLTPGNDLPGDRQKAAQTITDSLETMVEQGMIRDREDVVRALENGGLTVVRETKSSLSIADPDGGRNIRLKGALYERDFRFSESLRGDLEAAGTAYRGEREERVCEARAIHQRGLEIKREEHQRRYPRAERPADNPAAALGHDSADMDTGLWCAADRYSVGDTVVSGDTHRLTAGRDEQLQPAAYRPESEIGGGGGNTHGRHPEEQVLRGAAEEREGRRAVHLEKRQTGSDLHREIAPSVATEAPYGVFSDKDKQIHDRDRKTAAECVRALTGRLRDTTAGMAGQLRQLADHVHHYFRRADAQRPGVSALERAGGELAAAGHELNRSRQPLDAQVARLDRELAQKQERQKTRSFAPGRSRGHDHGMER